MGGSGLYSLAQVALFEVGPAHKPSLMGAMIGLTLAVSYVLGPVLGGVISATVTWRWIFWIKYAFAEQPFRRYPSFHHHWPRLLTNVSSVPFGVVLVAIMYIAWPASLDRHPRGLDAIRRIDFLGNILIIAACALLVFALQEAGTYNFAWNHPVIVLALVVSVLSWLGFAAWELSLRSSAYTRIEPILPHRLMGRAYAACVAYVFYTFKFPSLAHC